ncbi:MAG: cytochrome b5 domain-containing protein, partial [Actinobacteria bacterium]|nr:cytochrome b5 domain-containing protein [Actinomycetota bacterium]
ASCWTVIDNNVYNLTNWISSHPGGAGAIQSLCGVDGTASFKAQHTNQFRPQSSLSSYLLGPLSK